MTDECTRPDHKQGLYGRVFGRDYVVAPYCRWLQPLPPPESVRDSQPSLFDMEIIKGPQVVPEGQ